MSDSFSSGGDPKRTMELLWGVDARPRRGPKPKLTLPEIVQAAIALADAEGVEALSMRKVAEQLGVAVMSLYTYIPGKAELIDVMLDRVLGETNRDEQPDQQHWRVRLEAIARENWRLYLQHPWLLQVAASRPPLGPGIIGKYDHELQALDGIGLSDLEMDQTLTLVLSYVHGAVRSAVDLLQIEQRTGMDDWQWWSVYGPLLEQVLDPDRFPTAGRVGSAASEVYQAASDPNGAFEFGLQRVLDGIEGLLRSRG